MPWRPERAKVLARDRTLPPVRAARPKELPVKSVVRRGPAKTGRASAASAKEKRSKARKAAVPSTQRKGYLRTRRRLTSKTQAIYADASTAIKDWLRKEPLYNLHSADSGDVALSDYCD